MKTLTPAEARQKLEKLEQRAHVIEQRIAETEEKFAARQEKLEASIDKKHGILYPKYVACPPHTSRKYELGAKLDALNATFDTRTAALAAAQKTAIDKLTAELNPILNEIKRFKKYIQKCEKSTPNNVYSS